MSLAWNQAIAQLLSGRVYTIDYPSCSAAGYPASLGDFVSGVMLKMYDVGTGALLDEQETASDGQFDLQSAGVPDIQLIPSIDTTVANVWGNGVTTFDAAIIDAHVINDDVFTCPFQRIASDVNNNGMVDTSDALLIQELIVGDISRFTEVPPWRFIARNYTRSDAGNRDIRFSSQFWTEQKYDSNGAEYPFLAAYQFDQSTGYEYSSSGASWMDQLHTYPLAFDCSPPIWDFYALKSGDANQSANPMLLSGETIQDRDASPYTIDYQFPPTPKTNKQYQIDVWIEAAEAVQGFQFAIQLVNGVTLLEMVPSGELTSFTPQRHVGLKPEPNGNQVLRTSWYNRQGATHLAENGLLVLSLITELEPSIMPNEAVWIDPSLLEIEVFGNNEGKPFLMPANLSLNITEL